MMSMLIEDRKASPADLVKCIWEKQERRYRCHVIICPEEDGGYSAVALRLPGVVSQGDTEDEALHNIAEAFRGAVQTYLDDDGGIPWQDSCDMECTEGSVKRWILVDV
jgi:predicted RNase H-like HicB family nuclease